MNRNCFLFSLNRNVFSSYYRRWGSDSNTCPIISKFSSHNKRDCLNEMFQSWEGQVLRPSNLKFSTRSFKSENSPPPPSPNHHHQQQQPGVNSWILVRKFSCKQRALHHRWSITYYVVETNVIICVKSVKRH